ncbi:MAG TPA: DUF2019 domain-containing protein [Micropepsaceae bacterium]|nr:DUF2019 domain-containing protein [Micropepsaceae bacterium]
MSELSILSIDQLVDQFRAYALEQEIALLDSDTDEYNRLYDKMGAIDSELRVRGMEARTALLRLLDDENFRVRYEAAVRSTAIAPERALATLKEIAASHKMPEAGDAGMALYHHEQGISKPT